MKRFRIGLRLMLLAVALAAVLFALLGAWSKRMRAETQGRVRELQLMRKFAVSRLSAHPEEAAEWRTSIQQIDEELAAKQGSVVPK